MIRAWLIAAALGGFLSVAAGAAAAHLPAGERGAELLRTGALYGMVHGAALIAVTAMARSSRAAADYRGLELCRRHAAVQPQPFCAGAERTRMARYDYAFRRRGFARRLGSARLSWLEPAIGSSRADPVVII